MHLRRHKVHHIENSGHKNLMHVFDGEKCRSQTVEGAAYFSALLPETDFMAYLVCHHSHCLTSSEDQACMHVVPPHLKKERKKLNLHWEKSPPDS